MTIDEIAAILVQAISEETPLKEGQRRRDAVREYLGSGPEGTNPYPYRVEWLHATAMAMIGVMGDSAEAFNKKYPSDMVSASDLFDALLTALNMVVKQAGLKGITVSGNVITIDSK